MKIDIAEQFELLPHAPIVEAVIQIHARPETAWNEKEILARLKPKLSEFETSFSRDNVKHEVKLKVDNPNAHSDTRLVRKLANGNYLVAHESDGAVREYDKDGKIVWEFAVPLFGKERKGGHGPEGFGNSVFSATRLVIGNTLIGAGNGHSVLEVTPSKDIIWQIEQNDLPGITLAWVTRVDRLANGNTLIGNCHAGPSNPQIIEVTPEKKVLWTWNDFNNFGNSTTVFEVLAEKK